MKTRKLLIGIFLILFACMAFDSFAQESPPIQTTPTETVISNPTYYNPAPVAQASMAEYGLVGALALGVLGLLGFSVKSDKANSINSAKAMDKLAEAVEAMKTHNELMMREFHASHKEIREELSKANIGIGTLIRQSKE